MNRVIDEDIRDILADKSILWERFRNKSVLITGASGMLPVYMAYTFLSLNKLYNYNIHLYALARNWDRAMERFAEWENNEYFSLIIQDVSQPIEIDAPLQYIIHAASQASPKYYSVDPVGTINANVLGTLNTLNLAKEKQVEGYLFFSTGDVYGVVPNERTPFKESDYGYFDLLNVRSCYGESKRMGEQLCVAYHHQYNVPTHIVRIFHTYGPCMRLDDRRVFADFVGNILRNENITLRTDGGAVRPFCYVSDAVRAYFKVLLDGEQAAAYNIANTDEARSIRQLAEELVQLYPEKNLSVVLQKDVNDVVTNAMKSPVECLLPDCSLIHSLGWMPMVSVKDGFKRTIDGFMNI